jgi:tRNA pseudouridine55 synthase
MADCTDGIVLVAKQSGMTSFTSLWQVKNALGTKKTGHTGTLDNFADGLLVALTGRMTHLASFITDCDKEYFASISFGVETDTLDPDGSRVRTSPLPRLSDVERALPAFTGAILQRPPQYSAVHVDGKRASDRIRSGEAVQLPARPVAVHDITILEAVSTDAGLSKLVIRVSCSKGTYIRSLARDIAAATHSCASLSNLRRTRIGPFSLENAAGFSMLAAFDSRESARYGKGEKPPSAPADELRSHVVPFTREIAKATGLSVMELPVALRFKFMNGTRFSREWFPSPGAGTHAVFCGEDFLGVVTVDAEGPLYNFVVGSAV